jgi:hypothetical protein
LTNQDGPVAVEVAKVIDISSLGLGLSECKLASHHTMWVSPAVVQDLMYILFT